MDGPGPCRPRPGDIVTEAQLRNLFGEGRHPHAGRIEADQLAAGKKPEAARRAGALGRRVNVTGFDLAFRPQPTLTLLWALGDEETRRAIEAAHERAIAAVLARIEDEAARHPRRRPGRLQGPPGARPGPDCRPRPAVGSVRVSHQRRLRRSGSLFICRPWPSAQFTRRRRTIPTGAGTVPASPLLLGSPAGGPRARGDGPQDRETGTLPRRASESAALVRSRAGRPTLGFWRAAGHVLGLRI
ncbi:relaxase domain-containing protein [Streptomyces sp. NPDC051286]|uniref:relaxase domain-containing protein n=1 Tax=Streptomyces sp. NPDC051286 TaxID=3365647 RepID=UPI0037BD151F